MNTAWYDTLSRTALAGGITPLESALAMLTGDEIKLLPLLHAAFRVREHYFDRKVSIHIINNVQNGLCSEDCAYCAQARTSKAPIAKYTTKSDEEIITEAGRAYEAGALRYCMVYAGRGINLQRVRHLCTLIQAIKAAYPLEVCVSAGILNEKAASRLRHAGLDRLNHNLNTAASHYGRICTTHTFEDRLNTLKAARRAGLEVCSGIIAGMGETPEELIELALILRRVGARSIPVNFLLDIPGNTLIAPHHLTPQYCLKILCLFRFINPDAEIRIAAGREKHLRSLEVMSLYPANSLFMDGYLNTRGDKRKKTLAMIRDAGFTVESEFSTDELLKREENIDRHDTEKSLNTFLKTEPELRPARKRR
jgi:biotin synthase